MGREAAEEVLGLMAARVEGMGGVKGWRQKEREKRGGFSGGWGWEEEGVRRRGEDEGGGDERDDRDGGEAEESGREFPEEEEDSTEEVTFLNFLPFAFSPPKLADPLPLSLIHQKRPLQ